MHFVDQGWKQVDARCGAPPPAAHAPRAADREDVATVRLASSGPSLHAFTPRVRMLVQCARIRRRMTLSDVSAAAQVPVEHMRGIEEGTSFPSNRTLEALQRLLDVQLVPTNAT